MEILRDGDSIQVGRYTLECIETPGHTPGHICLYSRQEKIFVAGDHILGDITPNIQCWSAGHNPLKDYFESFTKVYDLEVKTVIPGHRTIFSDFQGRIDRLRAHHSQRLEEVERIVQQERLNGFDTASRMSWDIKADSWEAFPIAQQWFATGEALAHLHYLESKNRMEKTEHNGIILWQALAS